MAFLKEGDPNLMSPLTKSLASSDSHLYVALTKSISQMTKGNCNCKISRP